MELSGKWLVGAGESTERVLEAKAAMQNDGMQLRWIRPTGRLATSQADLTPPHQDYKTVCMAAVKQNGMALQHASAYMRGDEDVVVAAAAQDPRARAFASAEMRALTKHQMDDKNKQLLPQGVCRTHPGRLYAVSRQALHAEPAEVQTQANPLAQTDAGASSAPSQDRLEVAMEGQWQIVEKDSGTTTKEWPVDTENSYRVAIASEHKAARENPRSLLDNLESLIGTDLDGDGRVGQTGKRPLYVTVHATDLGARLRLLNLTLLVKEAIARGIADAETICGKLEVTGKDGRSAQLNDTLTALILQAAQAAHDRGVPGAKSVEDLGDELETLGIMQLLEQGASWGIDEHMIEGIEEPKTVMVRIILHAVQNSGGTVTDNITEAGKDSSFDELEILDGRITDYLPDVSHRTELPLDADIIKEICDELQATGKAAIDLVQSKNVLRMRLLQESLASKILGTGESEQLQKARQDCETAEQKLNESEGNPDGTLNLHKHHDIVCAAIKKEKIKQWSRVKDRWMNPDPDAEPYDVSHLKDEAEQKKIKSFWMGEVGLTMLEEEIFTDRYRKFHTREDQTLQQAADERSKNTNNKGEQWQPGWSEEVGFDELATACLTALNEQLELFTEADQPEKEAGQTEKEKKEEKEKNRKLTTVKAAWKRYDARLLQELKKAQTDAEEVEEVADDEQKKTYDELLLDRVITNMKTTKRWKPFGRHVHAPEPHFGIGTVTTTKKNENKERGDSGETENDTPLVKVVFPNERYALGEAKNGREAAYYAFRGSSPDLQMNKSFVQQMATVHGGVLEHAFERFRHDPETVTLAVMQNAFALRFAEPSLQEDKDIVRAASGIIKGSEYQGAVPTAYLARQKKDNPGLITKKSFEQMFSDTGKTEMSIKDVTDCILGEDQKADQKAGELTKEELAKKKWRGVLDVDERARIEQQHASKDDDTMASRKQDFKDAIEAVFARPDLLTGVRTKEKESFTFEEVYTVLSGPAAYRLRLNLERPLPVGNPLELTDKTYISKPLQSVVVTVPDMDDTGRMTDRKIDMWPGTGPVPQRGTNRGALRYANGSMQNTIREGIERRRQQLTLFAWADMEIKELFFQDQNITAIIQRELMWNDYLQGNRTPSELETAEEDWKETALGLIELGILRDAKAANYPFTREGKAYYDSQIAPIQPTDGEFAEMAGKQYVQAALKKNGYALRRASKLVQADEECVTTAVTWYGAALEYAAPKLQRKKAVVEAALKPPPLQDPADEGALLPRKYTALDPEEEGYKLQLDRPPLDDTETPARVIKDPTCWSHLPGSEKGSKGRKDRHDILNEDTNIEDALYNIAPQDKSHMRLKFKSKKDKARNKLFLKAGRPVQLVSDPMIRGKLLETANRPEFWSPREELLEAQRKFKTVKDRQERIASELEEIEEELTHENLMPEEKTELESKKQRIEQGMAEKKARDLHMLRDCIGIANALDLEKNEGLGIPEWKQLLEKTETDMKELKRRKEETQTEEARATLESFDMEPESTDSGLRIRTPQLHAKVDFSDCAQLDPKSAKTKAERNRRIATTKQFVSEYLPHFPWPGTKTSGSKEWDDGKYVSDEKITTLWVPVCELERTSPLLKPGNVDADTALQDAKEPLTRGLVVLTGGDKRSLKKTYARTQKRVKELNEIRNKDGQVIAGQVRYKVDPSTGKVEDRIEVPRGRLRYALDLLEVLGEAFDATRGVIKPEYKTKVLMNFLPFDLSTGTFVLKDPDGQSIFKLTGEPIERYAPEIDLYVLLDEQIRLGDATDGHLRERAATLVRNGCASVEEFMQLYREEGRDKLQTKGGFTDLEMRVIEDYLRREPEPEAEAEAEAELEVEDEEDVETYADRQERKDLQRRREEAWDDLTGKKRREDLRAELQKLEPPALKQRAAAIAVAEEDLEAAKDAKDAVIELILDKNDLESPVGMAWVELADMEELDTRTRVKKNWQVLKWAHTDLQNDEQWLAEVREKVQEQNLRGEVAQEKYYDWVEAQAKGRLREAKEKLKLFRRARKNGGASGEGGAAAEPGGAET